MKLITLSGLDGSGKSTQVKMLKEYLEKQGKTVKYFHIINFSIANKILTRGKNFSQSQSRAVTSANFCQIFLRKIALLIDIFRFRNYFLMLNRENKINYLISDRFFYDQIINLFYLQKKETAEFPKFIKKYLISPDLKIYLKISPKKIMARERTIEQGLNYLEKKEILYNSFCAENGFQIVDGEKDKDLISQEIINLANKLQ